MKFYKNEKGAQALNDYMIAFSVFLLGTYVVTFMYMQIYKLSAKVRVDEAVIGYITEICEQIDLKDYDDVSTIEGVNALINKTIANTPIKDTVVINCTGIEKYKQTENNKNNDNIKDYVERIHLKVSYTLVNNKDRSFTINKIKVKEL